MEFTPVLNSRFAALALALAFFSSLLYAWTGVPAVVLAFLALMELQRHPGRRRGLASALVAAGVGTFFTILHASGMRMYAVQWENLRDLLEFRAILFGP